MSVDLDPQLTKVVQVGLVSQLQLVRLGTVWVELNGLPFIDLARNVNPKFNLKIKGKLKSSREDRDSLVARHFAPIHLPRFRLWLVRSLCMCWWFSFLCMQTYISLSACTGVRSNIGKKIKKLKPCEVELGLARSGMVTTRITNLSQSPSKLTLSGL